MTRVRACCRRRRRFLSGGCGAMAAVPAGAARGAQPAFRIQQKDASGDDPFTLVQAGADFDTIR